MKRGHRPVCLGLGESLPFVWTQPPPVVEYAVSTGLDRDLAFSSLHRNSGILRNRRIRPSQRQRIV